MSMFAKPSWLPSIPYAPPDPNRGYWLPVTSTINWCEEDYYATIYAAEIINTFTNLLFAALAFRGLWNCYRDRHDRIFMITFAGYMAVGIGSFMFHASLKYPMQLLDELSMIYTTCFSCFSSFSYRRSRPWTIGIATFLISLSVFITAYYHYLQDPLFHQRAYALLTATVLLRQMYVMEKNLRPRFNERRKARVAAMERLEAQVGKGKLTNAERKEQLRQDRRDEQILRSMWAMVAYGLAIFLSGFAIWKLDNVYCSRLRMWRREIGLPWGILLEGHGWWHIMTGIGAYFYITWGMWLRACLNGRQDEYELRWPNLVFSLPEIILKERVKPRKSAVAQNGSAKKEL